MQPSEMDRTLALDGHGTAKTGVDKEALLGNTRLWKERTRMIIMELTRSQMTKPLRLIITKPLRLRSLILVKKQ